MWARAQRGWRDLGERTQGEGGYELVPPDGHGDEGFEDDEVERIQYDPTTPGPAPTASQRLVLKHIPAPVPWTSYTLAAVEFAERASYYGVGGLFANFIQRPLPPGSSTGAPVPGRTGIDTPGALGKGLQVASALVGVFNVMAYTTPLIGGALADMRWGKFRTIVVGTALAALAHVLSVYAALPSVLLGGHAVGPFIISLLLLGGSTGLLKANIAPLMAEQFRPTEDYVTSIGGEKVIIDREETIQRIMSAYYHSINIGAFAAIGSTFAEKYVGFWFAFLIPGIMFLLMPPILWAVYPRLAPAAPPSSSALIDAIQLARREVTRRGLKPDEDLPLPLDGTPADRADAEQALSPTAHGADKPDLVQALQAVKLFLFFTIYNVADGGLNALMTSLAGSMTTHGIPNDVLEKANPFAIVVSIPLLNKFLYPYLAARSIAFGPVRRVVAGFILAAVAMLWCAGLQLAVYKTSPCGYEATTCDGRPSPLSAWLVLPAPLLTGLSESIAVVSAMELGYTMSPPSLRSIVNALFLFMQATSALLVLMFLPLMRDPALVWPFLITAVVTLVAGGFVWRAFRYLEEPGPTRHQDIEE